MADPKSDILFSVHDFDKDGDITDPGIFLHFGPVRVKVADDLDDFRAVLVKLNGMAHEIEENYPEFEQ